MPRKSKIGWTDATHNFWSGCREVDTDEKVGGCFNCYSKRVMTKQRRDFYSITKIQNFDAPLRWKKPTIIFSCSMSDFFIQDADEWRDQAWDVIRQTPHIWLLLTKREKLIRDRLPSDWGKGWPNVWLGTSASDTSSLVGRADTLLNIPAKHYFLSAEPLLGKLNVTRYLRTHHGNPGFDWIITGGESDDEKPRIFNPAWATELRLQAGRFNIPFFFKQNGGNVRDSNGIWGGDLLLGQRYAQFPPEFDSILNPPPPPTQASLM